MKNFDEMLPQDREFTVGGETFHWRDVRPEVLTSFAPDEPADGADPDPNAAWKLMDDQILLFVVADEHDRWRELRLRDERAVTIAQMNEILLWLMEAQTGRPTQAPSPSASGRTKTPATSRGA